MSHWVLSNQAKDIKPKLLEPKSIQYYFQHSTKNFLLKSTAIFSQNINKLLLFSILLQSIIPQKPRLLAFTTN